MNTNQIYSAIIGGFVGVLIGYGVWGMNTKMTHEMQNGQMVHNVNMHNTMDDMTGDLEGKTGDVFDKAFLEGMIVHHEGAVAMAEMVLNTSKRPELLTLAREIISAQQKEISLMREWRKAWFID